MIPYVLLECLHIWRRPIFWLIPTLIGALLLCFWSILLQHLSDSQALFPVLSAFIWMLMALFCVGEGSFLNNESFMAMVLGSDRPLTDVYRLQWAILSLFLVTSALALIPLLCGIFDIAWLYTGKIALLLALALPSWIGLGHLVHTLIPEKGAGQLLLSLILLPLYLPLLLLTAMGLESMFLSSETYWAYAAILGAFQLILWVVLPWAVIFGVKLKC